MQFKLPNLPLYVVKSHEPYNVRYKRVIYILRHPADVFASFYRYLCNRNDIGSQTEFAKDWVNGRIRPGPWRNHVLSWLGPQGHLSRPQILLVRYEDMLADTGGQLERIAGFAGVCVEPPRIRQIVEDCTLEKMKVREDRGNRRSIKSEKYRFIDQGIAGDWRSRADAAAIDIVRRYDGDVACQFGYHFGDTDSGHRHIHLTHDVER